MTRPEIIEYREDHAMTPELTLLEASAGTGKTYSVTLLYLRHLLEQGLEPKQIVVTTFTRAAAAELRERIHLRLAQAEAEIRALEARPAEEDTAEQRSLRGIVARAKVKDPLATIVSAREKLDSSHIETIHTFAQTLTNEFAMASGTPSDVELVDSPSPIIREVWQDLQYTIAEKFPRERQLFVLDSKLGSDVVALATTFVNDSQNRPFPASILKGIGAKSFLAKQPAFEAGATAETMFKRFSERAEETDRRLREIAAQTDQLIARTNQWLSDNKEALSGNKFSQKAVSDRLAKLRRSLERALNAPTGKASDALQDLKAEDLKYFTEDYARAGVKKGFSITDFSEWGTFEFIVESLPTGSFGREYFVQQLALQVQKDTLRVMRERGVRGFSDMIQGVVDTLDGPSSELFVRSVRAKYKAAIIDEFQDTDQSQWEIFNRLFGQESFTYLIGDPKQAIYAFRGANVAVYEKVRSQLPVERRMTLATNYRSDRIYNEAVNALFEKRLRDELYARPVLEFTQAYVPVKSPARNVERRLRWLSNYERPACNTLIGNAHEDAALIVRHRNDDIEKGSTGAETLKRAEWGIENCADEIAWTLQQSTDTHAIHDGGEWRRIKPSDCAVLVRSRSAGIQLLLALRRRQVPAVIRSTDSIARSEAAEALFSWIDAVEEPSNLSTIRTFLTSPLVGMSLNDVLRLDEKEFIAWSTFFANIQSRWWSSGFITSLHRTLHSPVFRDAAEKRREELEKSGEDLAVLSDEFPDLMSNLLRQLSGERIAADLLHLSELVHKAQERQKMSPAALRTWLAIQHEDHKGDSTPEAFRERVESDGFNVQIVTAHASKGLEYPLVWCVGLTAKDKSFSWFSDPDEPTRRYPAAFSALTNAVKKESKKSSKSAEPESWEEKLELPDSKEEFYAAEKWLSALYPCLYEAPLNERNEAEGYHLDLEAAAEASRASAIADELRLFYVALTRARLRCVVYLNDSQGTHATQLLSHTADTGEEFGYLHRPSDWPKGGFRLESWLASVEQVDGSSPHLQRSIYRREAWTGERPSARIAPEIHRTREGMTSFSSLSLLLPSHFNAHAAETVENDDVAHDELRAESTVESIIAGDFEFPEASQGESDTDQSENSPTIRADLANETPFAQFSSGKDAGTALHRIFEVADFDSLARDEEAYRENLETLIQRELPQLGLSVEKDGEHLLEGVIAVLKTPLGGPLQSYRLNQLGRGDRIDELEFTMAMGKDLNPAKIRELFAALSARKGDAAIAPSWFESLAEKRHIEDSLRGMLLGFIDLVFRAEVDGVTKYFVADYKSNRIVPGDVPITSAAFTQEAMREEMSKHHYYLQYHIYLLALHRWLRTRIRDYDYDTHIGGAYYLFVRGMTGDNTPQEGGATRGVFFDRPSKAVIEAMDQVMRGESFASLGGSAQ